MAVKNLDHLDEEFSNFLYKVNQVKNIVDKLASNDKNLQEIGDLEAKQYLGENTDKEQKQIDENGEFTIKTNRTVINREALLKDDNPETQSKEAFMKEISKDADRRYKEKMIRKERMETFKKQATLAFRRGEYEKALTLYTKAIEQIRDSCLLYTNRALTYINLKFYKKAITDCETALRLNENSLKAGLLIAKAYFLKGEMTEFRRVVKEVKEKHNDELNLINDFLQKFNN